MLDDGVQTLAYFRKDCNKKRNKNENVIMIIKNDKGNIDEQYRY